MDWFADDRRRNWIHGAAGALHTIQPAWIRSPAIDNQYAKKICFVACGCRLARPCPCRGGVDRGGLARFCRCLQDCPGGKRRCAHALSRALSHPPRVRLTAGGCDNGSGALTQAIRSRSFSDECYGLSRDTTAEPSIRATYAIRKFGAIKPCGLRAALSSPRASSSPEAASACLRQKSLIQPRSAASVRREASFSSQ